MLIWTKKIQRKLKSNLFKRDPKQKSFRRKLFKFAILLTSQNNN